MEKSSKLCIDHRLSFVWWLSFCSCVESMLLFLFVFKRFDLSTFGPSNSIPSFQLFNLFI